MKRTRVSITLWACRREMLRNRCIEFKQAFIELFGIGLAALTCIFHVAAK